MGLFRPKNPPDTISDEQMASLRRRAVKANPKLDRLDDLDAIRRRKMWAEQHGKRTQS